MLNGHQYGIGLQITHQQFRGNNAVPVWLQNGEPVALALQLLTGSQNGAMFGGRANNVATALLIKTCRPKNGQVIRFGSAGGPGDGRRIGIDQVC